jgi:predicted ATP-binding protein involved in virulence
MAEKYRMEVEFYLSGKRREERPPRNPISILGESEFRQSLLELFHNNCAYCGSNVGPLGEIDQFRPYQGAEGLDEGVAFQHYCWLALEWENLYLTCADCIREKRNRFPASPRGPLRSNVSQLRQTENDTLLDPCHDAPFEHLRINHNGELVGHSKRGQITIDVLDLNRSELVRRRTRVVEYIVSPVHSYDQKIGLLSADEPFSGIAWLALLALLPQEFAHAHRFHSNDDDVIRWLLSIAFTEDKEFEAFNRRHDLKIRRRYVRQVRIKNFRGLSEAVLDFPNLDAKGRKGGGSVVALGDNGVGKTSLLQAVALGCLGPVKADEAKISPKWCLKDGQQDGQVEVAFWGTDELNIVKFNNKSERFRGSASVPVMVLGYGAYRLAARAKVSVAGRCYAHRIRSLFSERAVVNGALGLRQHLKRLDGTPDTGRLEDATRALNTVLQGRARVLLDTNNRLAVEDNGRIQPLNELSSGFKSIVAITADIMDVMYHVWDGMTSAQALVLIDEIDAHLHPSWRIVIVEALRETFPLTQFLMTTHDPLPLRGLDDGEIVVLDREGDEIFLEKPPVRGLDGMSVDQMLTSNLFGLDTTLDAETADLLARYYSLLSKPNPSVAELAALQATGEALPPEVPLGDSLRERLMFRIADKYLARHHGTREENLSEETISELVDLFEAAEREMIDQDSEFGE